MHCDLDVHCDLGTGKCAEECGKDCPIVVEEKKDETTE